MGKSKKNKSRAARDAALAARDAALAAAAARPPPAPRVATPPVPPPMPPPPPPAPAPPAPVVCPPPHFADSTNAPTTRQDPRYLGDGGFKMVWLPRSDENMDHDQLTRMKHVVVNAFDGQLFRSGRGTRDQVLRRKMDEQENEYEFTLMVREEFPDLVPRVYKIPGETRITPQPRYRYYKDRCESFPKDAALFPILIQLIDQVIDR